MLKAKVKWRKSDTIGWLILLPSIVLFTFFIWEPLIENIRISLYSAKGYTLLEFVGLENYSKVIGDPGFSQVMLNTFGYTLWSLVIGFVVPIVMGILISETVRFRGFFRSAIYFPNIVPGLATVWIWSYFFTPGPTGVLNILLEKIGIDPQTWLTHPGWTIPLIVITMTWKSAGSTALIYMACISGISPDLYEAATIDGAGIWKRIRYITLPSILGNAKTMLILQVIAVFQILYEPMVMTNGGPNGASESLMQRMYNYAYRDYNFPKAAALSVMICIILIILSGIYMLLTRKKEEV